MADLTLFYLTHCPYCKQALGWLETLQKDPRYQNISIDKIEESENPAISDQYDYQLVPCFWKGQEKLCEGVLTEQDVKNALESALK